MHELKLLAVTAILSAVAATPGFAQQAAQEPGAQAFYQSLGVGSHDGAPTSAMASVRNDPYAMMISPKHISVKHHVRHKN
jgi:hypothetical protein